MTPEQIIEKAVLQVDVDGFVYFFPPPFCGGYTAHQLRVIADRLDELNEHWNKVVDQETKDQLPTRELNVDNVSQSATLRAGKES